MRVTIQHWETLVTYAERNPEIVTNVFIGAQGRENLNRKWNDLAVLLNEVEVGTKTVEQWRKSLSDYKSNTKKKFSLVRRSQTATGGGPGSGMMMEEHEMRLLLLMGKSSFDGDEGIEEYGLGNKDKLEDTSGLKSAAIAHSGKKRKVKRDDDSLSVEKENSVSDSDGQNTSARRIRKYRKSRVQLAEHIQEMNDSTLSVLNSIDRNIENIARDINKMVATMVPADEDENAVE